MALDTFDLLKNLRESQDLADEEFSTVVLTEKEERIKLLQAFGNVFSLDLNSNDVLHIVISKLGVFYFLNYEKIKPAKLDFSEMVLRDKHILYKANNGDVYYTQRTRWKRLFRDVLPDIYRNDVKISTWLPQPWQYSFLNMVLFAVSMKFGILGYFIGFYTIQKNSLLVYHSDQFTIDKISTIIVNIFFAGLLFYFLSLGFLLFTQMYLIKAN